MGNFMSPRKGVASGMLVQIKDKSSGKGVDLGSIITQVQVIASQSLSPTSAYNLMKSVADLCLHINVDGVDADEFHSRAEAHIKFAIGPKLISSRRRSAPPPRPSADRPTASPIGRRHKPATNRKRRFAAAAELHGLSPAWRRAGEDTRRCEQRGACKPDTPRKGLQARHPSQRPASPTPLAKACKPGAPRKGLH